MTTAVLDRKLTTEVLDFVENVKSEARAAFDVFRETGTITANGTVNFIERIPGEDKLVTVNYAGPWDYRKPLDATVTGLDGTVYLGRGGFGGGRFNRVFNKFPEITTLSHVHSPNLGAWAQTHRSFPFHYVPVQRFQLVRELPIYIDRRTEEADFIVETLEKDSRIPGILEANGGATVWGWGGLRKLAEFILILEEGANIQIKAQAIGGSREFGAGVLKQQWKMSGLYEQAQSLNLLRSTDH